MLNWPHQYEYSVPNEYYPEDLTLREAFDVFMQRLIYKRIHRDNLEPVDIEPTTGGMGDALQDKLEARLDKLSKLMNLTLLDYTNIGLTEEQEQRVARILPKWHQ